jgi:hypothetical protein
MSIGNFTPGGEQASSLSMDDTLYYYEPTNCNGTKIILSASLISLLGNCTVHVAFAGCQMTYADVGLDFVTGAGYNGWAEANDIVM